MMLELLSVILFCWLSVKAVGLALKAAWGITKVIAALLFTIAVPVLVLCLIFAGGLLLLIPVAMVAAAFALLKAHI